MTVDQLPLRYKASGLYRQIRLLTSVQDAATVNEVTKKSTEKRPRSAYTLFLQESAAEFTAAHKGLSIGERAKATAAAWRKVPQAEKER